MLQKKWYYYFLLTFLSCVKVLSSEAKATLMEKAVNGGINKVKEWLTIHNINEEDEKDKTILYYAIGKLSLTIVQHLVFVNQQQQNKESADKNMIGAINDAIGYYIDLKKRHGESNPDGTINDFSKEKEGILKVIKFLVDQDIENIHKRISRSPKQSSYPRPSKPYNFIPYYKACKNDLIELIKYFEDKKKLSKEQWKDGVELSISYGAHEVQKYLMENYQYKLEDKSIEKLLDRVKAKPKVLKRLLTIDQFANFFTTDNRLFQKYIAEKVKKFESYTASIGPIIKKFDKSLKYLHLHNGYAGRLQRKIQLLTVLLEEGKIRVDSEYAKNIFLIACNQPYRPSFIPKGGTKLKGNLRDLHGEDPTRYCYIDYNPENLALIKLMLKKSISLSLTNSKQQTGLMLAAMNGKDEIVTLLLDHIENEEERKRFVDLQDENGMTAWMLARKAKHDTVANLLQNTYHADVNKKNKDGETGYTLKPDERSYLKPKVNENAGLSNKDTQKSTNSVPSQRKPLSKTEITLIVLIVLVSISGILGLGYWWYKKRKNAPPAHEE